MNTELAQYLRRSAAGERAEPHAPSVPSYSAAKWRIKDRLSDASILRLIAEFKSGRPKHELAKRYGIGLKSVKKLLREHGVKKRSRYERLE